ESLRRLVRDLPRRRSHLGPAWRLGQRPSGTECPLAAVGPGSHRNGRGAPGPYIAATGLRRGGVTGGSDRDRRILSARAWSMARATWAAFSRAPSWRDSRSRLAGEACSSLSRLSVRSPHSAPA